MNRLARRRQTVEKRSIADVMTDLPFTYGGMPIWARPMMSLESTKIDPPAGDFDSMVDQILKGHDVIAAVSMKRAQLVSELRFKWRSVLDGDNGRLWGDQSLAPLEHPSVSQTRPQLLKTADLHVSFGGAAFFWREMGSNEVRLLNPGRTSVVLGSDLMPDDPGLAEDAVVVGYMYQPRPKDKARFIPADEVAAWCPEPDPINWWRGVSWVQSVISEFVIDKAAHTHIVKFFENAATPQMVFTFDPTVTSQQLKEFAEVVDDDHTGAMNAYKNLFLGGGADAKVVGADLSQLDLRQVIGLTETRIALRGGVPAVIAGISEGMQGSSLNSGNYQQTRRLWSDVWFTPHANDLCASLEKIVPPPVATSELGFDPKAVMFLQDDRLDESQIKASQSQTMRTLIDAGFEPDSVVAAVNSGDFSKLVHSGLYSVQLQAPGSSQATPPTVQANSFTIDDLSGLHAREDDTTRFVVATPVELHPTPVTVHVDAPQVTVEPSPVHVTVPEVHVPEPTVIIDSGTVRKTVVRDDDGNITEVIEERS